MSRQVAEYATPPPLTQFGHSVSFLIVGVKYKISQFTHIRMTAKKALALQSRTHFGGRQNAVQCIRGISLGGQGHAATCDGQVADCIGADISERLAVL
jgi:hypothetical protein